MMKVDGQMSRGDRDKCPEDPCSNKKVSVPSHRENLLKENNR